MNIKTIQKFNIIFLLSTIILFSGCTSELKVDEFYWPTDNWLESTPDKHNMDSEILDGIYQYIDDFNIDMHSVVVIRDNYIISEKYYEINGNMMDSDEIHYLYSATKSINSALIGIAIEKGYIDSVEDKILDFFADRNISNVDNRKMNMTIEHLLTMSTGFDWDEWSLPYSNPDNIYNEFLEAENRVQFILDRPMSDDPGDVFNYNTGASHLLPAIIQKATEMSTVDFAQQYLFDPIGIDTEDVYWTTDNQGINKAGGLHLTARDMAKFGILYLNNGTWNGTQVLPASWVNKSIQEYNYGDDDYDFGYHWWLHPELECYAAEGYGAQRLIIFPDYNLVVSMNSGNTQDYTSLVKSMIKNYILLAIEK